MPDISFVAASGGNFSATRSPTTVAEPAGCADNDILLVYFSTDTDHSTNGAPPAGWTKVAEIQDGTDTGLSCFWKRRSGAESATWTNIFAANESGRWIMLAYRDCITTGSPLDVAAITGTETATAWDTTTITPVTDRCMVVAAFGADPAADPRLFTWDAGITERIDSHTTPTGQNALLAYITIGDKLVTPAAGTTLGGDVNSTDTAAWIALALKPAPVAAPGPAHRRQRKAHRFLTLR